MVPSECLEYTSVLLANEREKMSERYWQAGNPPDCLLDWVNENVVEAIKNCWEDENPPAWADVENGRMFLVVAGPEKPTEDDPLGERDIYKLTYDVLAVLTAYTDEYQDMGCQLLGEEQLADMRERAAALKKLADEIYLLSERAAAAR